MNDEERVLVNSGRRKKGLTRHQWIMVLSLIFGTLALTVAIVVVIATFKSSNSDEEGFTPYPPAVVAKNGAVAADNAKCSEIGVEILKKGGNAIDSAIATALCQGILSPFASGIGGGGVALVRMANGVTKTFDMREMAPAAAHRDMFLKDPLESSRGAKAIAIPGELKGLSELYEQFGSKKIPWADLVAPSIKLARDGFPVQSKLAEHIKSLAKQEKFKDWPIMKIFAPEGVPLTEGQTLRYPKLAETLQRIADEGVEVFYEGDLGEDVLDDVKKAGGIWVLDDIRNYSISIGEPLETFYHGYHVLTAPPPFSGGPCSILGLNILEKYNLPLLYSQGKEDLAMHWVIEAMNFAYSDRMALGDPDYEDMTKVLPLMISKAHASELRQRLDATRTFPPKHYIDLTEEVAQVEHHGTTHLSVVDSERNTVAITSTVNLDFGSYVVSESTGILLNDEMDDFSSPNASNAFDFPPSKANFIKPGKRPLSSMSPTIVLQDGELYLSVGGSGGSKIISGVFQVLLNVLAFNRNISEAIAMPRFHTQLIPIGIAVEKSYNPKVVEGWTQRGHTVYPHPSHTVVVQGIMVQGDELHAFSDPRKNGKAAGY